MKLFFNFNFMIMNLIFEQGFKLNSFYRFFVGFPFLRNLLTPVVKEQGQLLHVVVAKVYCQGLLFIRSLEHEW
jgi:hypothetical protein